MTTFFPPVSCFRVDGCQGRVQHVVVKLIFLIPQANALTAEVIHRGGNAEKVLEELRRDILVNWIFTASSSAMRIMLRQNIPIQLVPLLCSSWLPSENLALRSNTPMLSSPRNPGQVYASEEFAALAAAQRVTFLDLDYAGQTPMAKGYGTFPMYHARRA